MKYVYKIFSVVLITSLLFTLVGCSLFNRDIDNNSSVNSGDFTSSERVSSDEETSFPDETISSENEDLSSNSGNTTTNTSSNVTGKPSGSTNTSSTTGKPSGNTSSTVSKPQSNTSSTSSSSTSSTMSTIERWKAYGYEIFYDENVKLHYRIGAGSGDYIYESKYDEVNITRDPDYSNWDPVLKMYYRTNGTITMSWYDGGWHGRTDSPYWNEKYRNGYWKLDMKTYTDGTSIVLREYEYEEDETYDSSLCIYCHKPMGNGTGGTCSWNPIIHYDWKCNLCGAIVKKYACHSCPDHIVSDRLDVYGEIE